MLIGVPRESHAGESRVAATPETVKKLASNGHCIEVEHRAGTSANYPDRAYEDAGAKIVPRHLAFAAELVLKVQRPTDDEVALMKRGAALVGMLDPHDQAAIRRLAGAGVVAFSLEAAPRTTRAQALDVLSSQANIAGYKSVLLAANLHQRFMPMLMTAAGTVKAARVLVLGAGVAGLQAIATAKRLGAVVEASDVRPSVKEQVESLGARFVDVPYESEEERAASLGHGGYAGQMPDSWLARQAHEVHNRAIAADIIIATALIPGRTAPTLIPAHTVGQMKPGAVIVDLAAGRGADSEWGRGGNCPLSEVDRIVMKHGVHIVGHTNIPSMVASDASALYARNVFEFLKLILAKDGALHINLDDDIVAAVLQCHDGKLAHAA
jgi:H+-translocating NAD(P) transhydrogenase subunit alpha